MGDPGRESSEALIAEIGTRLLRRAAGARPSIFDARGLRGKLLAGALAEERLRAALFLFVDVLPQLDSAAEVAEHFRAYLSGFRLGGTWGRLLRLGASPLFAPAVRASVRRLARNFLVEETPEAIRRVCAKLARLPATASFDAVGEAVLTEAEADEYLARNLFLLDCLARNRVAAPNLSIKLSALTPRFDPLDASGSRERVMSRLRHLMPRVQALGATLTLDMEHNDLRPLVHDVFAALLETYPGPNWIPGIAVQAYLCGAHEEAQRVIDLARSHGRRICVRLVKGAYWDTEVALAVQRDWPIPVLLDKAATDAQYEALSERLLDAGDAVYPAFATHNVRSIAHAVVHAYTRERPQSSWEVQMLFGMAEPLAQAVAAQGIALRIYVPTGDLIGGIAYLIRRLAENTANTSVLRQTWLEPARPELLLAAPAGRADRAPAPVPTNGRTSNTPLLDFSQPSVRAAFERALKEVRAQFGATCRLAAGSSLFADLPVRPSVNPADPDEVLGLVEQAGQPQAAEAVRIAVRAFPAWRSVPAAQRAALCRRAAELVRGRRLALAAWEVYEAGKNWREADADVAEAADFLDYYAAQMESLGAWRATRCYPGERNEFGYEPRGVAAVIAPWNFPLAILTGMTAAALVTGNTVIAKPAGPTPIIAHRLLEILYEAGFPEEVVQLLPGPGAQVGDFLVGHPEVATVAFTGSREIGFRILRRAGEVPAGQVMVKRVVCEMGGKNAILIDRDADLDQAVSETLVCAFGYQGQKCSAASRVIVLDGVYERFLARLTEALDAHSYGPPESPRHLFGPVISAEAKARIERWIAVGEGEAKLVYRGKVPSQGYYVAPAVFSDVPPDARIATEEIFGPVVCLMRAGSFDQALALAMHSDYALTGGVFTRLPAHAQLARERFLVGNLYINRRITGARVGVQPFGGIRHSGTGVQAGGPDYIKQFMWSRVVSENTLRHGFVPFEDSQS
ncbi:MAG TPA: proline dehydrogenase family protein [Burkholderiales bacterium]|nr:proline dehydrogenase family protein [Burkholderiales bacterium]